MKSQEFYEVLGECGLEFFTGVPDSLLKDLCGYIDDNVDKKNHVITANEGGAVGLALGYYLSSGKVPIVYMQNSGLGNIVNPILSLADREVYGIPMVLLIGWRGQPGVKDEPQHVKQGRVTPALLNEMEIPYKVLPSNLEDAKSCVSELTKLTKSTNHPVALLIEKGTFEKYNKASPSSDYEMNREDAIKVIVDNINSDSVLVSTTGKTSRELFEYRKAKGQEHSNDFLTVGGMGHASQIALGVRLGGTNKRVFCIDGDGAALMHMGGMPLIGEVKPQNFVHVLLDNEVHDSVGGQSTAGSDISFGEIAKASGYENVFYADTQEELSKILERVSTINELCFIEVKVRPGARADLGRPTNSPAENKDLLMAKLKE